MTAPTPSKLVTEPVRSGVAAEIRAITALRHELHQIPEVMFTEHRTSGLVQRELRRAGHRAPRRSRRRHRRAGVHPRERPGVRAEGPHRRSPRRHGCPADPRGTPACPTRRKTPGVMHACGHDGHTAIAPRRRPRALQAPDRPNNVLFVFQPAEEGGAGGEKMCVDGVPLRARCLGAPGRRDLRPARLAATSRRHVATRDGPLLAATDEFDVTVRGKGAHAAYPHLSIDPIVVARADRDGAADHRQRVGQPAGLGRRHRRRDSRRGRRPQRDPRLGAPDRARSARSTPRPRALAEAEFRRIVDRDRRGHGCPGGDQLAVGLPGDFKRPPEPPSDSGPWPGGARRGQASANASTRPWAARTSPSTASTCPPASSSWACGRKGADSYPGLHTPKFDFNDDATPARGRVDGRSGLARGPESVKQPQFDAGTFPDCGVTIVTSTVDRRGGMKHYPR